MTTTMQPSSCLKIWQIFNPTTFIENSHNLWGCFATSKDYSIFFFNCTRMPRSKIILKSKLYLIVYVFVCCFIGTLPPSLALTKDWTHLWVSECHFRDRLKIKTLPFLLSQWKSFFASSMIINNFSWIFSCSSSDKKYSINRRPARWSPPWGCSSFTST